MKINYNELITLLETKSNRAISRLDKLKCYTPEFQETLDSIIKMLEAAKKIEKYDCDCTDCKEANSEDLEKTGNTERKSPIGQKYETFNEANYE